MLRRLSRGFRRLPRVVRDGLGGWLAGTLSGVAFRAQPTLEPFLRTGASMRFHPKSRASTDQRPGPNIVSAPAIVAARRRPTGGSPVVRISRIATTATTAPATGVHSPAMRRSAASREQRVGDDDVQRKVAPEPRASVPEYDRADDQSHQQQADAWPSAGECGIEASQHVPRHNYWAWAARREPPHRVGRLTLWVGGDG